MTTVAGSRPPVTVIAHDVGAFGGMERQLGELCRGLLERGHRVTVIARRCEVVHPGLRFVRVRVPRRPFSVSYPAFFLLGSIVAAFRRDGLVHTTGAVVANQADVSTVHFCHAGFQDTAGWTRMSRPGLAYRINGVLATWMSRFAERYCYRPARTRRLVAVSQGVAGELQRLLAVAPDDVTVIPNGVDPGAFAPDAEQRTRTRRRLGLSDDDLVAVFVGGEWKRKGLPAAIEGIARTGTWHLLVVGQGDEEAHRQLAARYAAVDRVHFVGGTTNTASYYASADVLLLPTSYEAFPLVSLEAAACGLPLLITRVSGAETLLVDGVNGWFVRRDAGDICRRLEALGADPAVRQRMGAAARASIERYGWDRVVDSYELLYAALDEDGTDR